MPRLSVPVSKGVGRLLAHRVVANGNVIVVLVDYVIATTENYDLLFYSDV